MKRTTIIALLLFVVGGLLAQLGLGRSARTVHVGAISDPDGVPCRVVTAELRQHVEHARVARLATVDSEGRPHVVPICFVLAGDILYSAVDRKPKRSSQLKRLENIRAHPSVAILVDHYEEDWSRLWWVRVRGRGRVLEEGEERERALALLAEKYAQYRAQPPVDAVIAIDVSDWRSWLAQAGGSRSHA